MPAARVHELRQRLPTLSSGEGVLEASFHHYSPAPGTPPTRARIGADPLNRETYLWHVQRRI